MAILPALARQFQFLFPLTDKGQERFRWFLLTLKAIPVPITVSRTSNLLRAIETLFGVRIAQRRCYTFMASVKLPWDGSVGSAVASDSQSFGLRALAAGARRVDQPEDEKEDLGGEIYRVKQRLSSVTR